MGSIPDRGTKTQMLQGTDQKKKEKEAGFRKEPLRPEDVK